MISVGSSKKWVLEYLRVIREHQKPKWFSEILPSYHFLFGLFEVVFFAGILKSCRQHIDQRLQCQCQSWTAGFVSWSFYLTLHIHLSIINGLIHCIVFLPLMYWSCSFCLLFSVFSVFSIVSFPNEECISNLDSTNGE